MTSDEFDSKYRLLKQIAGGRWRTFTAEHRLSRRAVLAHFVDQAAADGGASLLSQIEQLKPIDRSKLLETMTVGGSLVFVTEVLDGLDFESWLRSKTSTAPDSVPQIPPASPPPAPATHGEFTQLFRPVEYGDTPLPGAAPADASGVFGGHQPPPPAAPAEKRAPEPAGAAPGASFTELFRASASAKPAERSVKPADRLDQAPPPIRVVGLRVPAGRESVPPPPKPNFGGGLDTPLAAPEPIEPRLPRDPYLAESGPASPLPPPPQPVWAGPSDFSRQLERLPVSSEVPAAAASPQPSAPPAAKPSYVPLLLVLNLVVIIATGLVVYFALKRC
jgi:hypothetical protein